MHLYMNGVMEKQRGEMLVVLTAQEKLAIQVHCIDPECMYVLTLWCNVLAHSTMQRESTWHHFRWYACCVGNEIMPRTFWSLTWTCACIRREDSQLVRVMQRRKKSRSSTSRTQLSISQRLRTRSCQVPFYLSVGAVAKRLADGSFGSDILASDRRSPPINSYQSHSALSQH